MDQTIEATYEVVTPLFSSGADQAVPELRATSLKGVLRFWWRALAWPRLRGDRAAIESEEARVFGSSGAASRVSLMVRVTGPSPQISAANTVLGLGDGARYLGYGLMEAYGSKRRQPPTETGQLLRPCFRSPFEVSVAATTRGLDAAEVAEVRRCMRAVGMFGGLGARARRGYGSLVLQSLRENGTTVWQAPPDVGNMKQQIHEIVGTLSGSECPPYTAFSGRARVLIARSAGGAEEALNRVGRAMVRFRSWGRGGLVLGNVRSEHNFQADHDLMEGNARHTHPERIAFGLPHNYGREAAKRVGPAGGLDRRASPLFIHIHRCGAEHVAVLAFLPADFLPVPPPDARPKVSVGGTTVDLAGDAALWKPIHDFLDRFVHGTTRERLDSFEVPL